jgi:nicotinamidase-related amidase
LAASPGSAQHGYPKLPAHIVLQRVAERAVVFRWRVTFGRAAASDRNRQGSDSDSCNLVLPNTNRVYEEHMPLTTLREVSGLPSEPTALADAALVLIDCQNTYREGTMELVGVEAALIEAQSLLKRARAAGIPIFHIQHDAGPGSPYDISTRIGRISDEVSPQPGEPVITKHFPNSFVQTNLEEQLRAANVTNLLLAGFMTHMCVNSTARGAFNLGFQPTVVAAATATRDLPGAGDEVVTALALQAASLAALRDLFAVVVPTAQHITG